MAIRPNHLIDLGMMSYNNHLYWAAAQRLQQGVEQEPDDWDAWLFLGMSYLKEKAYEKSEEVFNHISASCPSPDIKEKSNDFIGYIHQKMRGH